MWPMFNSSKSLQSDPERKRLAKNRKAREARADAKAAKIRSAFCDRCDIVIDGILDLGSDPSAYLPAIPKLFDKVGKPGSERYDVFQELDEKPAKHWRPGVEYWAWHAKLRQVRNHPIHGRELFAVINGKEIA